MPRSNQLSYIAIVNIAGRRIFDTPPQNVKIGLPDTFYNFLQRLQSTGTENHHGLARYGDQVIFLQVLQYTSDHLP